jgi:cell division protein FtsB
VLEREVLELQTGNQGLEQRAREQLGLIREGETYYQLVDDPKADSGKTP